MLYYIYMSETIDLSINGWLFPLYIMKNYKEYIENEIEEECIKKEIKDMRKYQAF